MAFWNRKKKPMDAMQASETIRKAAEELNSTPAKSTPPPCPHTWVDFPWYLDHSWKPLYNLNDQGESILTIYEPYVCVHCQKRKDVRLYSERETGITAKRHWAKKAEWEEQYKEHLKPKPIVEDMINDAILVDRGKVAIVAKLRGINNEGEGKKKNPYRVELSIP